MKNLDFTVMNRILYITTGYYKPEHLSGSVCYNVGQLSRLIIVTSCADHILSMKGCYGMEKVSKNGVKWTKKSENIFTLDIIIFSSKVNYILAFHTN